MISVWVLQVELVVSRPPPLTPTLSLAPSIATPIPSPIATSLHEVRFQKGPGHKSLGFSIVGGRDSPKGDIGVFVKSVFPDGQAAEHHKLLEGNFFLSFVMTAPFLITVCMYTIYACSPFVLFSGLLKIFCAQKKQKSHNQPPRLYSI